MGVLFVFSLAVAGGATPGLKGGEVVSEDRERAPLLDSAEDRV